MRGNIFEYMAIAEIWAEFYGTKKSAAALTLHYSIINTANRNQWKEWVLLNYDHLTRILAVSEKTIKAYLDLLSDPEFGIIEKEYDFRNKGKIAVRLKQKSELQWVVINSHKDYEFLKNPPSILGSGDSNTLPKEEKKEPKKIRKTPKNKNQNKEESKKPKDIEFTYGENPSNEFGFNNMMEFANKNYNSFPEEVKNTISEKDFMGYQNFYKTFGLRYFNNPKYKYNVTPFEYKNKLSNLTNDEIQESINKIIGSAGFYENGSIATRIVTALSWNNAKQSSNKTDDVINFNGAVYTLNHKTISMMKIEERERVKRIMYNTIQSCSTVDTLPSALVAKKILDSYKINGETNIDNSTVDHSSKIISKLQNLLSTKEFIQNQEDIIKEFLSKLIIDKDNCKSYFIYCYATHINNFHLQFSYSKIIEELYKIESITTNEALAIKTKEVLDRVVENYMKQKSYPKSKIYEYSLDAISSDLEFMEIWKLHVTSITAKTTNFKLK